MNLFLSNPKLEKLELRNNKLKDDQIKGLSEAMKEAIQLKSLKNLKYLDLSENDYLDMQDLNYEFNKLMHVIFRQLHDQIEVLKL